MLIDSRKLPIDEVINAEVCIVGAAPAGITLARELIGHQAKLTNHWSKIDICSVKRSQLVFAEEFASAGLGKLQIELDGDRPVASLSTHHNMGTTRMLHDPKQGVVDANCQVHGISNLFITGSSVFPTGGYANPTLTIVALAIRLADHLKAELF
ncbi:GMC family oxidoreductase [Nostoc sp. WHI]|uniref:GMC oxidoreductase n=1 Tax=Nostoc sp. WHI TaxID=2650611 RepID=UPI0018C72215|nr:hypothetical protein [Nostoc sp. WHI]